MKARTIDCGGQWHVIRCYFHTTSGACSVVKAQLLQPTSFLDVLTHVNRINARDEAMVSAAARRFVKVAPPTVHAGVGNALREAFALDGEPRSLCGFEELLAKLD